MRRQSRTTWESCRESSGTGSLHTCPHDPNIIFFALHIEVSYSLLILSTNSSGVSISILEKPNHFLPKSFMDIRGSILSTPTTQSFDLQVAPFEGKASLASSCNSWVTAGNSAITSITPSITT